MSIAGAALGHVLEHDRHHVLVGSAQREHQVLLVDLAEHLLDGARVELGDVLEHEQHPAHFRGEVLVGSGEVLQHVALGGAVGVVEDPGQRLGPARGGVDLLAGAAEFVADHLLDLLDHARARLAHAGDAQGDRRLVVLGQVGEHVGRQARRKAREHERHRLGGLAAQQRRDALGRHPAAGTRTAGSGAPAERRPSTSAARSGPSARSITSRANSIPPLTPPAAPPALAASSLNIDSVVSAPTERSRAISVDRLSISSSPIFASTFAARSDPSAAIRTAALRAPVIRLGSGREHLWLAGRQRGQRRLRERLPCHRR